MFNFLYFYYKFNLEIILFKIYFSLLKSIFLYYYLLKYVSIVNKKRLLITINSSSINFFYNFFYNLNYISYLYSIKVVILKKIIKNSIFSINSSVLSNIKSKEQFSVSNIKFILYLNNYLNINFFFIFKSRDLKFLFKDCLVKF